jgi:hypothetical protein
MQCASPCDSVLVLRLACLVRVACKGLTKGVHAESSGKHRSGEGASWASRERAGWLQEELQELQRSSPESTWSDREVTVKSRETAWQEKGVYYAVIFPGRAVRKRGRWCLFVRQGCMRCVLGAWGMLLQWMCRRLADSKCVAWAIDHPALNVGSRSDATVVLMINQQPAP